MTEIQLQPTGAEKSNLLAWGLEVSSEYLHIQLDLGAQRVSFRFCHFISQPVLRHVIDKMATGSCKPPLILWKYRIIISGRKVLRRALIG